jgi:DNA polymerase (family X)
MGEKTGPLFPRDAAYTIAIDLMLKRYPGRLFFIAGSLRRGAYFVHDIDILIRKLPGERDDMIHLMVPFSPIRFGREIQVDIRFVPSESFGPALQYFTGSWKHNVSVRRIAKQRGLLANEYGVFRLSDNRRIDDGTEVGFYRAIGLRWLPPKYRNDYIRRKSP